MVKVYEHCFPPSKYLIMLYFLEQETRNEMWGLETSVICSRANGAHHWEMSHSG